MADTVPSRPKLGFIGMGDVGGPMALRLLKSKFYLSVFDSRDANTAELSEAGARVSGSFAELAAESTVVMVALPSERSAQIIEKELLPHLAPGKTLIDFGAMSVEETHALAKRMESAGAQFLDAPVSGGASAAAKGQLTIFVGGSKKAFDANSSIMNALASPGCVHYCGPAGSGQIVSGVDRLVAGLATGAFLEALAYGTRAGISLDLLKSALGENTSAGRATLANIMTKITHAGPEAASVRLDELQRLKDESRTQALPLTEALLGFLKAAPQSIIEKGKHVPSFWAQLQQKR